MTLASGGVCAVSMAVSLGTVASVFDARVAVPGFTGVSSRDENAMKV